MTKLSLYRMPTPDVELFTIPSPKLQLYRLCSAMANIPLTNQQFEADEDIGIRAVVSPTDRNQSISDIVVMLKFYDATTTPETYLFSKDNGDPANPSYVGGGKLVSITPERMSVDFVLNYETDLSALEAGNRTIQYEMYLVDADGRRCHKGKSQFTRKAA